MNALDYLRIAPLINDCPHCGNGLIGNGEGTLEVNEHFLRRACKCGFTWEYDVQQGTSKKKVQQAIDEALKRI